MTSYAKLYAAMKVMKGLRLLEIVNASDSCASRITVQLTNSADGADVSHFVEGVPRSWPALRGSRPFTETAIPLSAADRDCWGAPNSAPLVVSASARYSVIASSAAKGLA